VAKLKVEHFKARDGLLSVPDGKTERRDVALRKEAIAFFKIQAKGKLPGAWLISRHGEQWKKEQWRDEINAAAAAAKLPPSTCAYTLRHSLIVDLVKSGLDLFHVAKLAGTSILMIQQNYGKFRQEHVRKALDALPLS